MVHVPRKATPETTKAKDDVGEEEAGFSPEDVAQLAVQRLEGAHREEVAVFREHKLWNSRDPGVVCGKTLTPWKSMRYSPATLDRYQFFRRMIR